MHPRDLYLKFLYQKYGTHEPMTPERLEDLIAKDEANQKAKAEKAKAGDGGS